MNPVRRWHAAARLAAGLAAGLTLALMGGCATVPADRAAPPEAVDPVDPWENFNRKVFGFNEVLDETLLKPVATAYRDVLPQLVRTGIGNFFGNIYDAWSAVNHLLQGKLEGGLEMSVRVMSNTFFGLGGLLDPATEMRLMKRPEDFGQTLGHWGVPNGPFLVLPLFGPSTVRDAVGLWVDRQVSPAQLSDSNASRWVIASMEVINLRANLLQTTQLLDAIALDKYSFIRDAYLARRRDALFDGAPPLEAFDDWDKEPPPPTPQAPR